VLRQVAADQLTDGVSVQIDVVKDAQTGISGSFHFGLQQTCNAVPIVGPAGGVVQQGNNSFQMAASRA
jgi:hypothetical protein